mmetsp:Transcript_83847/g.237073  ORF Transcript_83847/g.237073 Transcript_83847/m.237073 type:complete len:89 (+) Transcript_83847:1923-2189(+)
MRYASCITHHRRPTHHSLPFFQQLLHALIFTHDSLSEVTVIGSEQRLSARWQRFIAHQVAAGQVNYELSGSAARWMEHQTLCTAGRIR